MAGSLNHIVGNDGKFSMKTVENMGDAYEALEECFHIIHYITGGEANVVNKYLDELGYPTIKHDMVI